MTNKTQMVEHHTHYKEIHGYDKTVWMTRSDHFKLHQRLRRNSECNVPVDEMKEIAMAAHKRTDKSKKRQAKYHKEHKPIEYENSPERIKSKRDYCIKNVWRKQYTTYMIPSIALAESIRYNTATNHISVSSRFFGFNKNKPLVVDIV